MMFAKRLEWNVAKSDDLIIPSRFVERAFQHRLRIFAITLEPFFVGASYSGGRILKALSVRVVAGPSHEGSDCLFNLLL